jgi:CMP-N-acetylneuraminic acid synthetase
MIQDKKILAVTLARGGSQSIPKKNIALINNKPLIQYTIDEAFKSNYIDDYCVSSDSDEIIDVSNRLGVKHIVKRPDYLSTSTAKSSDALLHAVSEIEIIKNTKYDYIVELMVTNPLKTVLDIDTCIEKIYYYKLDSVVSVVQVFDYHPSRVKFIEDNVLCDFYPEEIESRRQDLKPEAYIRNGSIYVMSRDFLLNNKSRYNKSTSPYIMPQDRSINIDEVNDFYLAEIILKKRDSLI